MSTLKLWLAMTLTSLSRKFSEISQWETLQAARLYGVEQLYEENNAQPPDHRIFVLLKRSDGKYNFHGIVAKDRADARAQAWHIPGSLITMDSLDEFRCKLLAEAERRRGG